jgi:hypothetical protein
LIELIVLKISGATITVTTNLAWNENVVDVTFWVNFARVSVGDQVVLALIYYKLKGLTNADDYLGLEAFQIWIILTRNVNLPWLLR